MGKKFVVIGAGMAGLLAAGILRDRCAAVFESQPSLPNNHNALLRFRSRIVGDALGIPFKKVTAFKGVATMGNGPIADMLSYAKKATGTATARSIATEIGVPLERYIAPPDLVAQMERKVTPGVTYHKKLSWGDLIDLIEKYHIISTMPMANMADMAGASNKSNWPFSSGFVTKATLKNVDAYATIYFPGDNTNFYRASVTGNELIIEYASNSHYTLSYDQVNDHSSEEIRKALYWFGLDDEVVVKDTTETRKQPYSKILPIDEGERLRIMIRMTDDYGIYSLGRFATWRPGLLLDDVVSDVHKIVRMADSGINYQRMKGI